MQHIFKRYFYIITVLFMPSICFGQDANEVVRQVIQRQQQLKTISYDLFRRDTIGTYIRSMQGRVMMERDARDTIFGFKFWARKEDDLTEKMYDGHTGYMLNSKEKTYETTSNAGGFRNLLNGGGGHLVLPDLVKLDIKAAIKMEIKQDAQSYFLLLRYPDITKYDVINKFKAIKIDKQTMLPVSVREHQETLGRIQDLYYEVKAQHINDEALTYNFGEPDFLKSYKHIVPVRTASPVLSFTGKTVPDFRLQTFTGNWVSTAEFKNKVVLLDFWEVWCSPCIESMPKVEALAQKYKQKGLLVYGITNETESLESARMLVSKKNIKIPMLIGSKELSVKFKITGFPLYILLDKAGKVCFIGEGYSELLEEAIQKALL